MSLNTRTIYYEKNSLFSTLRDSKSHVVMSQSNYLFIFCESKTSIAFFENKMLKIRIPSNLTVKLPPTIRHELTTTFLDTMES